jgi:hypothetical protein
VTPPCRQLVRFCCHFVEAESRSCAATFACGPSAFKSLLLLFPFDPFQEKELLQEKEEEN